MRYLGIDYGEKRIGIAISDETNSFAFPLMVIENSENIVGEVKELCDLHHIEEIVVGESKDFLQQENNIMKDIKIFVAKLEEETELPVRLHPEFLSSAEAEQIQGKNKMLDASAAAIILKSYLDTLNNSRSL